MRSSFGKKQRVKYKRVLLHFNNGGYARFNYMYAHDHEFIEGMWLTSSMTRYILNKKEFVSKFQPNSYRIIAHMDYIERIIKERALIDLITK